MTAPVDNKIVETKVIPQQDSTPVETPEQINWKKFREEKEQTRKAREEAELKAQKAQQEAAALKEAMDALLNKPSPQEYQSRDLSEDDIIAKKVEEALIKHRQKDEQERILRDQRELPQKLTQAYRDFDKVCTTENLDYLEYHYPEVAKAFQHMPESFDKWANVYNAVKRFIPNTQPKEDQKRMEKNLAKPQSASVPGINPTGETAPYILDEAKKKANQLRMQRVMRGL